MPHLGRALMCCALAFALALAVPMSAWAGVLGSDVVAGSTVLSRALPASACPSIEAKRAVLVDEQGEIVFARNADEAANIASITKVMTAVVARELAPLDARITVTQDAAEVGESTARLRAGDVLSLEDALKALMIPSGNDAAIAIAESLGRAVLGAQTDEEANEAFVAKMNEKAAELGCTDTVFENAHGLDGDAFAGDLHSTAADVILIVEHAMQDEYFRSIVDMPSALLPVERDGGIAEVEVLTTDLLLGSYEGACGVKTGFTDNAGACFAGACNRGSGYLYSVVLDSPSEAQRFTDTTALFDWYYAHCVEYALAHSDIVAAVPLDGLSEVPVVAEVSLAAWPDKTVQATFADPDATVSIFELDGNVSQDFEFYDVGGAVEIGQAVGKATFWQRNEQIAEIELVACEAVPAPDALEALQIAWGRLCGLFTGAPAQAPSVVLNDTPLVIG